MVAHFDYYHNKGDNVSGSRGVLLIPRTTCGESKMTNSDDTTGAYASSIANTTTCPAIASALSTVLGSYLISNRLLFSTATNTNIPSMAGGGYTGGSSSWGWSTSQCVLPNEIQIYGSTVASSSFYDIGESCEKLAVFNFINHTEYGSWAFWLRGVASAHYFTRAGYDGGAHNNPASGSFPLRPLIYIG
ncbi:MAG: hypothetical protein IKR19_07875 [Acholeplasmatales bacterium]|nr:hypothetical protein [Acholeplasmatales bacterium]